MKSLFVDLEFPRGRGGLSEKIMEIPGGGGKSRQALWNGKSWGVGLKLEKTLRGGYGYFLEPHIR